MLTYRKACQMVISGFSREDLTFRPRNLKREEKGILQDVLLIEKKIFEIYIKDQKCSLKKFPFNDIDPHYSMSKKEAVTIAKLLFAEGWTPILHVKKTREIYKNSSDYVTLGNIMPL